MRINPDWAVTYKSAINPDGSLLFPERLTEEFLKAARRTMGPYLYANQYLNQVIPEGMQTFKKSWKRYYHSLPESEIYHFAYIDPAISEADTADYTGVVVVAVDHNQNWYVRHAKRYRINPTQLIELCFKIAERYKTHMIGVEDVAFQRAIVHFAHEEMKRRNQYIGLTGVKLGNQMTKEMRILSLVPRFESGTLLLTQGLDDLEKELDEFPRGTHDDVCFVAGTLVSTPHGDVPIERLKVGDEVFTPRGSDTITHISHRQAPVVTRLGLRGTADHPVVSAYGTTALIDVNVSTILFKLRWLDLIRLTVLNSYISTVLSTEEWAGRDATTYLSTQRTESGAPKQRGFIALFTSFIRARKFQRAFTFTIKTAIHSITITKTLSVYRLKSTQQKLGETWKRCAPTWIGFAISPKLGIPPRLERPGTARTENGRGSRESHTISGATFVLRHFSRYFQTLNFVPIAAPARADTAMEIATRKSNAWCVGLYSEQVIAQPSHALANADLKSGAIQCFGSPGSTGPARAAISISGFASETGKGIAHRAAQPGEDGQERVYNLRTRNHHYYFANGILVSNCDALSGIAQIINYPVERKPNEPSPASFDYEKHYIKNILGRRNSGD